MLADMQLQRIAPCQCWGPPKLQNAQNQKTAMLMTRVLYLTVTIFFLALNGAALWYLANGDQSADTLVRIALIVNTITWPVALLMTYRIGQLTSVEYLRSGSAKKAALRAA